MKAEAVHVPRRLPGTAYQRAPDQRTRNVIAEVIRTALDQYARPSGCTPGERVKRLKQAALWLPSVSATQWFDRLGLEQRAVLERTGYTERLEELLHGGTETEEAFRERLTAAERGYLEGCLRELTHGE